MRTKMLDLSRPTADIFVPDGAPLDKALARTTHMGVGAHQDDLEIMALDGILQGFANPDRWFLAVIVTDGSGSSRSGPYAHFTDVQMREVRRQEQRKAAVIGEYGAAIQLDHPSSAVKDPANPAPREDLKQILLAARPRVVYIHNLADKHPTHVATALRTIKAIRELPADRRPEKLSGCEVWRDLDWMIDTDKVAFWLDKHQNIGESLVQVFDSQITGGKGYGVATLGRRRANATYHHSHAVDQAEMMSFGMDLTPLILDDSLEVAKYVLDHVDRFRQDVAEGLAKLA